MSFPHVKPGTVALRGLIPSASFVACADITVNAIAAHSEECTPGCLYVALPGTRCHGRQFASQAIQRGAAAILTDFPLADISVPQCIVADVAKAYGQICQGMYGHPSRRMGVAGVTGTNGKTTTTWILRSLLESAARPAGLIGTVEYHDGVNSQAASLTTPDALTLARCLAAMCERETRYVAMELSSHALAQSRIAGIGLDVAIVTNITHDHLDYHGTFEHYLEAKARISNYLKPGGILVLNADDPHWERFLPDDGSRFQVLTYGFSPEADIQAEILEMTAHGSRFQLHYGAERYTCEIPLIGRHNILNSVAAVCGALHLGLTTEEICAGLAECPPVPGRMEAIECGQPFRVFVDYAHTADALERALETVREVSEGDVLLVCGAGGDRDRTKRPAMGRAAGLADHVILTNDNPRGESPEQIIEDLLSGWNNSQSKPVIELDRGRAIEMALSQARPGDVVLIAGKGHEKYQLIGENRIPFDDVHVSRDVCRRLTVRDQPGWYSTAAGQPVNVGGSCHE